MKLNKTHTQQALAIFASGTGSNAQKIIDYFRNHDTISVNLIVCNKPDAGVLKIAEKEGIPYLVIDKKEFRATGYVPELRRFQVDWIILAGFLWMVPQVLLSEFPGKIINIHPSLLPSYGGKGMYGMAVHRAVVDAGEKQSGITIHYIDEEYDRGTIILQETVLLHKDETPESLAEKIHGLEHLHFAPTIEKIVLK